MSKVSRRRRLTRNQVAYFSVMRHFRKAWKTMPEYMERCRVNATKAAQAIRHDKHRRLVELLSALPAEASSDQIRRHVEPHYRGYSMRSMFNRIRRHGLLTFDANTGLWKNRCRLHPNDTVQESL